jgi:hypothetical protein
VGKRFGGWNLDTPHEKLEKLREAKNRKRNGPITTTNINVDETDEASTHEEKTQFSKKQKTLPIDHFFTGKSEHLPG